MTTRTIYQPGEADEVERRWRRWALLCLTLWSLAVLSAGIIIGAVVGAGV